MDDEFNEIDIFENNEENLQKNLGDNLKIEMLNTI